MKQKTNKSRKLLTKEAERMLKEFEDMPKENEINNKIYYRNLSTPLQAFVVFGWITIAATLIPLFILLLMGLVNIIVISILQGMI